MNNDASPSSSAPHNPPHSPSPPPAPSSPSPSQHPKPRLQHEQRAKHLDDLIRALDILIYCELSILYYMDCSLLHLLLRALPQYIFFTPKPALFPPPPSSTNRPYIATLTITNTLVLLAHCFSAAPAAGEAMRGYLHGGLVMDFVGVLGPVARWRLVGLDVLVWGLQFVVLAVVLERAGMQAGTGTGTGAVATSGEETGPVGVGQDYDAEERGMFRADAGDIELQDMGAGDTGVGERDDLLAEPSDSTPDASRDHPLDTYHTGEHVIANLHILDTLRRQWAQYGSVAADASTSSTTGSQTAMVAAVAGRRFGFRLRGGNSVVGAPS